MQTIIITGQLGKDAEMRSAGGSDVLTFRVASNQGYGDKRTTNWFRCNMWGKRGASLQPHLSKGTKVTVSGELEIREYQGKPQYEINASGVELHGGGQKGEERREERKPAHKPASTWDDPDDDFPF